MGFFSSDKPKISRDEFKKVCTTLYNKGWNEKELDILKGFFEASINETREEDRGLDKREVDQGVETLRKHKGAYNLTDKKLNDLQEVLNKYL